MTEPRQIAVVRSYDELLAALRARAAQIGATRAAIDAVGGFAAGHSSTLLAAGGARKLTADTLIPMVQTIGLAIALIEDPFALEQLKNRLGNGTNWRMLNGVKNEGIILKFSRRYMRKLGQISGQSRKQKISKQTRSRVARQAAFARWNPPDLSEMTEDKRAAYLKYQADKERRKRAKSKRRKPRVGVRC